MTSLCYILIFYLLMKCLKSNWCDVMAFVEPLMDVTKVAIRYRIDQSSVLQFRDNQIYIISIKLFQHLITLWCTDGTSDVSLEYLIDNIMVTFKYLCCFRVLWVLVLFRVDEMMDCYIGYPIRSSNSSITSEDRANNVMVRPYRWIWRRGRNR